jgi:hypothetical protein
MAGCTSKEVGIPTADYNEKQRTKSYFSETFRISAKVDAAWVF